MTYAYIIACYLGPRRIPCVNYINNPFYYIQKHLEFLKTHKIPKLDLILIMLNSISKSDLVNVLDMVKSYNPIDYKHDGIINVINNYTDIKYALLIEDDYLPCNENVFENFRKRMDNDTFYVCQFWTDHAAMSNGMIDLAKAKEIYSKAGRVFMLSGGEDYRFLDLNQRCFLNLVRFKYKLIGLNEEFKHTFSSVREGGVMVYGNGETEILTPII